MNGNVFRKASIKSIQTKPIKVGFKLIAKSNTRATLLIATEQLAKESGKVMKALRPYILGFALNDAMRDEAREPFGEAARWLMIITRILKVPTPTASKRVKLTGTRTAAFLQFMELTTELLGLLAVPDGPAMHQVEKVILLPKLNKKELRTITEVNTEEHAKLIEQQTAQIKELAAATVDLYWRLSLNIFGVPPAQFFAENAALVEKRLKAKNTPKPVLSKKNDVVFTAGPSSKAAATAPSSPKVKPQAKAPAPSPKKASQSAGKASSVPVKVKKGVIKTDISKLKKK